jgi:4-hydroxy-tetrahydrodipicolinate synthase
MTDRDLKHIARGIVVPLITPLADQGSLDHGRLERLIEHVIEGGVSGVFILGTTGEGPSLSHELRRELMDAVCRQAAGRAPVLVGVTDTVYEYTVAMARAAERSGASAVVLAPPFYFRISQTELLQWVRRFARESPLPVFLYNMPSLTKMIFEVNTVRQAAEIPGVIGLKDSSGDLGYFRSVVQSAPPDFPVLMGPEEMLVEAMRAGASGGVCGGANLNPKLFVEMYRAAAAGEFETAERLQERVRKISEALYTVGDEGASYLRGLKWAMSKAGLCSGVCALPLAPFTRDEERVLEARLAELESMV